MQCLYPITGWRSRKINPDTGKRPITFVKSDGFSDMEVTLPCSRCTNCRLKKSYETAIRCVHEASLHEHNHFLTLTYKTAPVDYSIDHTHIQLFMKKLRRRLGNGIKSYGCAEYGENRGRPHYHLLLFNCLLPDLESWGKVRGNEYYTSKLVGDAWSNLSGCEPGFHSVSELNIQTAAYVARYVTKKFTSRDKGHVNQEYSWTDYEREVSYIREPERTVAVSKGIGKGWLDKWYQDVYPSDQVIIKGKEHKPPSYYDYRIAIDKPSEVDIDRIKRERRYSAKEFAKRPSTTNPYSREIIANQKLDKLVRRLEDV